MKKKINVPNSNRQIVENGKIETPNKHIHDEGVGSVLRAD